MYAVNDLLHSDTTVVRNRGVTLCYPADYSPDAGPIVSTLLKAVEDQLDESQGDRLLQLPSSLFGDAIPGYIETYSTAYNPAAGQRVLGILYSLDAPPNLHLFFQEAWNGTGEFEDPIVTEDEDGLYRIYLYPALSESIGGPWIMIESPPESLPAPEPPTNWAVGYCSNIGAGADAFDCKLSHSYKDRFQYRFTLHEQNLHLRNEVKSYLDKLFQQWEENCNLDHI